MTINCKKLNKAFTVIELLVVIATMGLVVSIILVSLKNSKDYARITNLYRAQSTIHNGLGAYLLAEWRFNEGSGNEIKDLSGNNNHGIFHNNVEWTTDTPLRKGYGLLFDQNNECVIIDRNNGSLGSHKYNDFTITAWYKSNIDDVSDDGYIFHHYSPIEAGRADTIIFGVTDDGSYRDKLRFHYKIANGNIQLVYGKTDVVDQKWHFVAASKGAGKIKIYVDGQLDAEAEISPETNVEIFPGNCNHPHCVLSIGCEPDDSSYDYDQLFGILDEVLVYGEDLSLTQIKKLYAEGLPKRLFAY